MFSSVMILTDLSAATVAALEPLATFAAPLARVTLWHCVEDVADQPYVDASVVAKVNTLTKAAAMQALAPLAEKVAGLGFEVSCVVDVGRPADRVAQAIAANDIDLAIVPTRGQHAVSRQGLTRSTTSAAIRARLVPVLSVEADVVAPPNENRDVACIMHPVDLAHGHNHGLDAAVDIARHYGARLHLVHVVKSPRLDRYAALELDEDTIHALAEESIGRAEGLISGIAGAIEGVDIVTTIVASEHVGTALVGHASRIEADLVVLPAVASDATKVRLLGSVADWLIRHATCPVLTYSGTIE